MTHDRGVENWSAKAVQWILGIIAAIIAGGTMLFMTTAYGSMVRTESRLSTLEANYKNIEDNTKELTSQMRMLVKVNLYKAYGVPYEKVKDEFPS